MNGVAQVDVKGFVSDYLRARKWTARLLRQFTDEDLSLSPGPGSMALREQFMQICQSDVFVVSLLKDVTPDPSLMHRTFDCDTIAKCMACLKEGLDNVTAAAEAAPGELWQEEVEPFGPAWRATRGQLAYLMIDHESHHRGQITVYLRVAGKTPPIIWEPVPDSVFEV